MSKCSLRVDLDEMAPLAPGDEIRGRVFVVTDGDVKCDALTVRLAWKTHGSGNPAGDKLDAETIFVGEWRSGEETSYPFSLPAPNGPFTFRGHHLNVDWEVLARADIPWALDPKASADFLLPPMRTGEVPSRGNESSRSSTSKKLSQGCFVLFFIPFLLAGLGTLFAYAQHKAGNLNVTGDTWVMLIVGPVFTLVGLIPFAVMVFRWLARRKVGEVDLTVSSEQLVRGDELHVKLRFEPRADFLINEISLRLIGREEVVRGSGSHKTTHRHDAFVSEQTPISAEACRPFDPVSCEAVFVIPEDAPITFEASSNRLYWQLEARIDIPGPDWTKDIDLLVDP